MVERIIIVLGQKLDKNHNLSLQCRERCFCAYEYYLKNENCIFLLSGGKTSSDFAGSEAKAMQEYLEKLGVLQKDIILEENSKNTFQNAKYCAQIVKNIMHKAITVVSSSFHIHRWYFNPIRFFNNEIKESVDYLCSDDSGILINDYDSKKKAIFVLVKNSKAFKKYQEENDINIFSKIKGTPIRKGNKYIAYKSAFIADYVSLVKKMYFLDELEFLEI